MVLLLCCYPFTLLWLCNSFLLLAAGREKVILRYYPLSLPPAGMSAALVVVIFTVDKNDRMIDLLPLLLLPCLLYVPY